ncbi:elongator complex protein 5 [Hetaerina americana]|uniref:elongator complex protein 5 n=1 Tax=Hetaerina americana TaxID=62018 RepID=UPI003A7F4AFA
MSLSEIVTSKRKCPFLLITDNYEAEGSSMLMSIIQSLVDKKCEVQVLCLEHPRSSFKDTIRISGDSKVEYIDCFTDHKGWLGQKDKDNYKCELDKVFLTPKDNSVLVIDSLSSLIVNMSSAAVYKLIHQFITSSKTQGSRMVGVLHQDMVDEFEVAEIYHLAGTVLKIHPPKPNSHGRPLCYIHQKAVKGKHRRGVEHYSVDSCNALWSEPYTETVKSIPAEPVDPMADVTTFKLSLEEKEKEARSQLILPYMRNDPAKESAGSGVIHYQPDEMDDWDEEDPDNDLNI